MSKYSRFFLLLIILFTFTVAAQEPKTAEQYWTETGLNFDSVKDFYSQYCSSTATSFNAKTFIACVQSINVLASELTPSSAFYSDGEIAVQMPFADKPVKNFGALTLYTNKVKVSKSSFAETWKKVKAARSLQVSALTTAFNDGSYKTVGFPGLVDALKSQALVGNNAKSEGLISARMLDAYFIGSGDPHSHIDPIAQLNDDAKSTDVSLSGIGATLKKVEEMVVIENLQEGGPALETGLKTHDIIKTIDGKTVSGVELTDVVNLIRGPAGSSVKLQIERKGKTSEFVVVRRKITYPNVQIKTVNDAGDLFGYIGLRNFQERTSCDKISKALTSFNQMGAKGIIFDLRENGGGYLDQAVCIASLFVGKQLVVKQLNTPQYKAQSGKVSQNYIGERNAVTALPMVTLIDSGSASASEIVAGALQDYQRSWIAGDRSFGKASVQGSFGFTKEIVLFQTIARFYQPSGRTNQIVGIQPDFNIDPVPNATDDEKFALHEADYFTNALPAVGAPWVEARPQDVQKISACTNSFADAKALYAKEIDDAIAPDYRLLSAQTLLHCAL